MATARAVAGFTLTELLVALAIGAIVTGMALPGYRAMLVRAHRMEAVDALLMAATAQEKFHLAHGRYASGFHPDSNLGLPVPERSSGQRYRLSLADVSASSYVLHASAIAGAGQDTDHYCERYWIAANGQRGAVSARGNDTSTRCWP